MERTWALLADVRFASALPSEMEVRRALEQPKGRPAGQAARLGRPKGRPAGQAARLGRPKGAQQARQHGLAGRILFKKNFTGFCSSEALQNIRVDDI